MIRAETEDHWILITHPDHAKLAGEFADAWGNTQFSPPEPFDSIRYAVYHHDDGWLARDANPCLTPGGKPEAFTSALVGAYSAFEEIDLPSYLAVRGQATAAVAAQNLIAGIIVSMHTVNLLTEQADVSTIRPEHRQAHADFVKQQEDWQASQREQSGVSQSDLQRGFEFLQACDNLSLIACSGFDQPRALRHRHADRAGTSHELNCRPISGAGFAIDPWPFNVTELEFSLPTRRIPKNTFTDLESYRAAFDAAEVETTSIPLRAS